MHAVPLQLAPGSDLRRSLEEVARAERFSGFVLGVVGDLSQASFQCPGQPRPTVIEGDLEIITLNGTISPAGVHLHLSLSDGACQVWGGHLEPGTVVRKGAELLLGLLAAPASPPTLASPPTPAPPEAARLGHPRLVELAVLSGCPFSARAQRLLRTLGIPHQVVHVRTAEERSAMEQRSGHSSLPQVFIDGQAIGGYDALAELHGQGALEPLRVF
ncbi:MAG: PCC domain-containing protein [Cyanobacteriota bacterium]